MRYILRYFSIASLVCIVLAALLLGLLYRYMAIKGIVHLGENTHEEVAQSVLRPIKSQLATYLVTVAHIDKPGMVIAPLHPEAQKAIHELMQADQAVVRVKLYNRHGIVVYSTKAGQIGQDQREKSSNDLYENIGFKSAINGKVMSRLIYHDVFNYFKQATSADNLLQTYIPVRGTLTAPTQGVFEIYTDVSELVDYSQYTQIAIVSVSIVILMLLYLALLFIVRRAGNIIASQQATIHERTETLELLSAQLLTAQESERKRLATELHEGLAQTLSAIKYQVEHACQMSKQQSAGEAVKSLETIIAAIQNEIQKISALAMDLRPPSLDDLGIVATLDWYTRKFQSLYPEVRVEVKIEIEEYAVSRALKIIIYRIVQEALDNLGKHSLADWVSIQLHKVDDVVSLTIEDNGKSMAVENTTQEPDDQRIWFHAIQQRTRLSGGTTLIEKKASGGYRKQFTWSA